jgi:hypothetical protein
VPIRLQARAGTRLAPFLPCVALADRETFHSEVIERMVQATGQPVGHCFELFRRVHLLFRKFV